MIRREIISKKLGRKLTTGMTLIIPCVFQRCTENVPFIITDLRKDNSFEWDLKDILQQGNSCSMHAANVPAWTLNQSHRS